MELVEQMDLLRGERVLDVACGTGIVARFAAEKVGASGGRDHDLSARCQPL